MKIDLQILNVRYHIYISMKSTASNTDQSILTTNISRTHVVLDITKVHVAYEMVSQISRKRL